MQSPQAILFDFDGVIAHTQPIMQQALWKFFRDKKMAVAEQEYEDDEWASKSLAQVCDILRTKHDIHLEVDELRGNIWESQKSLFQAGLESDPTLLPLLEYCRQTGIKMAIGSNSIRDRVEWVLKLMKIDHYFLDAEHPERWYMIVGANDITHHKPDPEVWLRCAEILEVDITRCIAIDDHLPGLTGAQKAWAHVIYYHRFDTPENSCVERAERSVKSFGDLLPIR